MFIVLGRIFVIPDRIFGDVHDFGKDFDVFGQGAND